VEDHRVALHEVVVRGERGADADGQAARRDDTDSEGE
jgi:hypothetical protein